MEEEQQEMLEDAEAFEAFLVETDLSKLSERLFHNIPKEFELRHISVTHYTPFGFLRSRIAPPKSALGLETGRRAPGQRGGHGGWR